MAAVPQVPSFHELMRRRVRRILFVSSLYDSFVLSGDGRVVDTLLAHFLELGRAQVPDTEQVPDAAAALARLDELDDFDLVISSVFPGEGDVLDLARAMRAAGSQVPLMALAARSRLAAAISTRLRFSQPLMPGTISPDSRAMAIPTLMDAFIWRWSSLKNELNFG